MLPAIKQNEAIHIHLSFSKEDLICCVCYDSLNKEIFQCFNGNHFVCKECFDKICKNNVASCPICKESKSMVRNVLLEQQLNQFKKPCPNVKFGCNVKLFDWDLESHLKGNCLYHPVKCPLCQQHEITKKNFENHVTGVCQYKFIIEKKEHQIATSFKTKIKFEHLLTDKPTILLLNFMFGRVLCLVIIPNAKTNCWECRLIDLINNEPVDDIYGLTFHVLTKDQVSYKIKVPISYNLYEFSHKVGFLPGILYSMKEKDPSCVKIMMYAKTKQSTTPQQSQPSFFGARISNNVFNPAPIQRFHFD
ncbi:hypothetical protein ABK040_014227 [Willaertia magna]